MHQRLRGAGLGPAVPRRNGGPRPAPWAWVLCLATGIAAAADTPAATLEPFVAHYSVHLDGRERGRSTLSLERGTGDTWRYTLRAEGTRGLARLAGFEAEQTSVFVLEGGAPRLQRSLSTREALVGGREVETVFDWVLGEARWHGDVDADRRGPVALTSNAVNAHLLNLALALDVHGHAPGDVVRYRLIERGRADAVAYTIGPAERLPTPLGELHAIPLTSEQPEKSRVTTAWYAPGLPPTPVRVLRTRDGKPEYELRLLSIEP